MTRHSTPKRFARSSRGQTPSAIIPGLGVDVPELRHARALWQLNRFDESLEFFEKALCKYPQNLVALIDAGRAFGARFEIERAEAILDRLVKIGAHNAEVLHLAGQSYRMIFRPEKAMRCFERVLRATRKIPDAQLELAVLYERRHRVDDALTLMNDCLRADPDYLEAELFKGRLMRRTGDIAGATETFRKLAENDKAHSLVCAQAWTELAHQFDREGEFDSVMDCLTKSKNLQRADEGTFLRESQEVQRQLLALSEGLTQNRLTLWADQARDFPAQRLCLLTSFPRSGTTLLEQILDSHPGLVSSDEREAFARDVFPSMWRTEPNSLPTLESFDAIPKERLAKQRERYLAYMGAALNEPIGPRVHLDKNPAMTLLIPAMVRLFPETRLLIALRDPRDVVLSCFMQYLPLNTNSVCFMTLERTAQRYAHDMGAWRKLREMISTPWREIRYENCVGQLETEARRTLEFLELPWDSQVLQYRDRLKTKSVSSPTYEAVSRPLYTSAIGRWKNYAKYLDPCMETLRPSLKAFGY